MPRLLRTLSYSALTVVATGVAAACPVCFDGEDEARLAYQLGSAMLTLLPLSLMGGAALFLRHRIKQRDLEVTGPEQP